MMDIMTSYGDQCQCTLHYGHDGERSYLMWDDVSILLADIHFKIYDGYDRNIAFCGTIIGYENDKQCKQDETLCVTMSVYSLLMAIRQKLS